MADNNEVTKMEAPKASEAKEVPFLQKVSHAVNTKTEAFFGRIAQGVVAHPLAVILAVVLFTAAMFQGVWVYKEESSGEKNFTPQSSRGWKDRDWVVDRFGHEERTTTVFFVADDNVLSRESLQYILDFHNWTATQLETEGITYETVCARYTKGDTCRDPDSILSLWGHNPELFKADANHMNTINTDGAWRAAEPSGPDMLYYMSDPVRDSAGRIASAKAARLTYRFKNDQKDVSGEGLIDLETRDFELHLAGKGRARSAELHAEGSGVRVYFFTDAEEEEAGDAAIDGDMASLMMGYIAMSVFTCFVLSRQRVKYSHSALGLASIVSVGLSTLTALGLCWLLGVKFNPVVSVLILVLLGVGVDDTFVIMESWWDNAAIPDMKDRMVKSMEHAGAAIAVTSTTDLVAFLSGSSTSIPAMRDFCYYAALGVFFDFIYQCTFFVAIAYLDTKRQERSKADILCCVTVGDATGPCVNEEAPWSESDRGLLGRGVGALLPKATVGTTAGRVVVLVLAAFLVSLGVYGCVEEVEMDMNIEWFTPANHVIRDAYDVRDTYFAGRIIPVSAYFGELDYPDPAIQQHLELAAAALDADDWTVTNTTSTWYGDFKKWVGLPSTTLNGNPVSLIPYEATTVVPRDAFYPLLKVFASKAGPRSAYQHISNLRWTSGNGTALRATKMSATIKNTASKSGQEAMDALRSLRDAMDDLPDVETKDTQVFAWTYSFIFWDAYTLIRKEVTQNVSVAGAFVFVLVTLLVANLWIGLLVVVSLACVDVCLVGFMPLIGVALNNISMICTIVAIGLAVDYSVHIATVFLKATATATDAHSSRQLRAAYALWKMGPAVVNGGVSTFIAILPLAFAKSYVFKVFFRMFVMIIGFGQFFGVCFLPVLLSLIGPDPHHDAIDLDENPEMCPLLPRPVANAPSVPSTPNAPDTDKEAQEERVV